MPPVDNSTAFAEFSIPSGARYFRSIFGLARADSEKPIKYGRVVGRIYIDNHLQWSATIDVDTVVTQTYPIAIPVNAQVLRLEVDSLGSNWWDYATWVDSYFSAL